MPNLVRINLLRLPLPPATLPVLLNPYNLSREQRSLLKLLIIYRNSPLGEGQFWSNSTVPVKLRAGFRAEVFMQLQCFRTTLRGIAPEQLIERLVGHINTICGTEHLLRGIGRGIDKAVQGAKERTAGRSDREQNEAVAKALFPYELAAQPYLKMIDWEIDHILELFCLTHRSFDFLRHESSYPPE
jgi:hypothetical protein